MNPETQNTAEIVDITSYCEAKKWLNQKRREAINLYNKYDRLYKETQFSLYHDNAVCWENMAKAIVCTLKEMKVPA